MMAVERGKSLFDIAPACGFVSPSCYTKKFREVYGVTPMAFREKMEMERASSLFS